MSQHTIDRIAGLLENQFDGKIDMSDWAGRPERDRRTAFLSRAVAALAIKTRAGIDTDLAAASVTDGYKDGGIDALYFDQRTDMFYLVQSKWSGDGSTPINAEKVGAFVTGIQNLMSAKFERFGDKVGSKKSEITAALYSERPINFLFITAHTATESLGPHVKRILDDLVDELNNPVPTAEAENLNQAGVYGLITAESQPPRITLQIALQDWGAIEKPFLAYYGRVHVSEIVGWWDKHRNALFSQNLRLFYYNSGVNQAMRTTLGEDAQNFWYFNNGVTVICDAINKSPVGAPKKQIGLFTCENANIVNGAQTVGTIGDVWGGSRNPADTSDEEAPEAWVQVRIISLEKCPPGFSRAITRAANLQNAVGNREFAAMDPVQHRLATEFTLDQRRYAYKQGEMDPKDEEGCGIVEATQALACAHSIELAVQVKREIGALWANTALAPYTDLFNDNLTSTKLWRTVLIMRAVDQQLHTLKKAQEPKADLICVHLNRVILHLVFKNNKVRSLHHDSAEMTELKKAAQIETSRVFPLVAGYIQVHHENDYLASFCKNVKKCEALVAKLESPSAQDAQGSLL